MTEEGSELGKEEGRERRGWEGNAGRWGGTQERRNREWEREWMCPEVLVGLFFSSASFQNPLSLLLRKTHP